jgi:hypothetical protein
MPTLTRRRDPDSREEAWLIFYGDVHVGTISMGSGSPSGGLALRLLSRQQSRRRHRWDRDKF